MKDYINAQKIYREALEQHEKVIIQNKLQRLIMEGGMNSRLFWQRRKELLGQKNDEYDLVTEEGIKIEDPTRAKNYIQNYFENLYTPRQTDEPYKHFEKRVYDKINSIQNDLRNKPPPEPFTMKELNQAKKALKNKKACGPDLIPNEIFTNATKNIYLAVINDITKEMQIPHSWEKGYVKRIYKGRKSGTSAERGITLSSNFEKLYERLLNNRIAGKINQTEAQAGGRTKRSTTDHLVTL